MAAPHGFEPFVPANDARREFSVRDSECPVSQQVSDRLLRLPFYNDLGGRDLDRVVEAFVTAASVTLRTW